MPVITSVDDLAVPELTDEEWGGVPGGAEGRLTGGVVVDTNVFTAWLRGSGSPLALQYANQLVGRQVAVSPQTVAEAR